jgi:hypothetical protein
MAMKNIKLSDEQLLTMNQIFESIEKLSKDKDFIKKMNAAMEMQEEDVTEKNEDDYLKLLNLKEDIVDLTNCSFP